MSDSPLLTVAGLNRRLKRHLMKADCSFFAVCTPGLERFLATEVAVLSGAIVTSTVRGGVEFHGPLELIYHANLCLRTANRVILRIATFTARSYPELYNKSSRLPWELYTGFSDRIRFDVSAKRSRLHHTANIEKAVFDGAVEYLGTLGIVPVRDESARLCFFIRFADDNCTVSIDTTGDLLYKRGYKESSVKAPLRETIAAALLMASDFRRFKTIADPFCGSGTFIIEAAQQLRNSPAGSDREFAFSAWPSHRPTIWDRLRQQAITKARPDTGGVALMAGDCDQKAIDATKENALRAGVLDSIVIMKDDCRNFNQDGKQGCDGLIIGNPPYGKRIGDSNSVRELFSKFGGQLKKKCRGWHYGLIIADEADLKATGLKPSQRIRFDNGGITVEFVMGKITG